MKTVNNNHAKEVLALNPVMQIIKVILIGTSHCQDTLCLFLHKPVLTEASLLQNLFHKKKIYFAYANYALWENH